ncbi:MAG: AsmA-like C-terminal domain-containing protein [Nitrospirae bacterium]|nr:AsmA-like C-terminal domain-containing protein [Nitrospirota bacterium]
MGTGAVLLLAVAAALLLLPRLINKEMVREKIVHLLSQKISGTVTFQDADISLFPLPRVIIRNVSLNIPEKVSGTIRTVTVFPELGPLFRGEVRLAKIQINGPSLTLRIPAKTDDKVKSLEEIAALLRSLSLGSTEIRLRVDHGSIILERLNRSPVSFKEIGLSLDLANTKEGVLLTVNRLNSKDPGLSISAVLRVNPVAPMISLEAKGKDLDIDPVRRAALDLSGDIPVVKNIFDILRGGNIEQISFQSTGSSPGDLGRAANIKIKGRLNKGAVVISGLDLMFRGVSGDCDITEGILLGHNLKGEIMHSRISDGMLRIGLKGKDALLHADAAVSADMTDVHAILRKFVKNKEFLEELEHVRSINGKAEGRLVLGESLARVFPRIDIKAMNFISEYDRIPYPLEIRKGRFSYDEQGAAVKGLDAAAGKSFFAGLDAQLRTGDKTHLTILSGQAGIDTAEVHRWLSSYEKLSEPLRKIGSLSGRLNFSSLTFQGLVMDSQTWNFKLYGSAEKLIIHTPLLPDALHVNSGKFEARMGQLTFSDANTNFLDASSLVSGSLITSLQSTSKGDIRFSGTVGPKALQWIKNAFSIPQYIRTDQTISASAARLTWQERGDMAFQGAMKTAAGQSVVMELAKDQDHLTISRLDVADTVSKASFRIDLQEKKKQLSFKGRLSTDTAASLIAVPQVQGGMLQGDFTVGFNEGDPSGIIAQGRLGGEKIVLPWKKEMPLTIDSASLSADKGSVLVDSARLRLGANAFSMKGNITANAGGLLVDMDLSSDHILWDDVVKPEGDIAKAERQSKTKRKPQKVQGVVRLKTGSLDYYGFQVAPFHADIVMNTDRTDIRVRESSPCGVRMTGDISLSADEAASEMGMDLRFDATDQELKPTILCLSKGKSDATGLFTLKGRLHSLGRAEDLKKVVEGKVEFIAKKGTISRYKTLDTVFDFLNKGEELRGQMPDLDKSELSYDLLKVTASVGKGYLVLDEATIDSTVLGVVAQGSLNLVENRLDLNVMVAPLRQVNKIVRYIPLIGDVISGSLISVPVKVTGTPADPQVTYLSPSAAVSNLANMMKRTLNLPVKILSPLFPKEKRE